MTNRNIPIVLILLLLVTGLMILLLLFNLNTNSDSSGLKLFGQDVESGSASIIIDTATNNRGGVFVDGDSITFPENFDETDFEIERFGDDTELETGGHRGGRGGDECVVDSDCGDDGFDDNFCRFGDSYTKFLDYSCDNGFCELDIDRELDEVCSLGCFEGECIIDITCNVHSDCGINGVVGDSFCQVGDVYNDFETFTCNNPGTESSSCTSEVTPMISESCSDSCFDGECVVVQCDNDSECNDGDDFTFDTCNNPGTENSVCVHEDIECFNDLDCDDNDNETDDSCVNPGTVNSFCENEIIPPVSCTVNSDCGINDFVGERMCQNGDVYQDFEIFMCSIVNECNSETINVLVDECDLGCNAGQCITEICDDGIDNDGNGLTDGLVLIDPNNNDRLTVGTLIDGRNSPWRVMGEVANAITNNNIPLIKPTSPLVRSDGSTGAGFLWFTFGTLHDPTLNAVCNVLGYEEVISSDCYDEQRSGLYPNGKCNFHTPENDFMYRYNGSNFVKENATPKYEKTWLSKIVCEGKIPQCNDGYDNDGDGFIDLSDDGCEGPNDDSEKPHDPQCDL